MRVGATRSLNYHEDKRTPPMWIKQKIMRRTSGTLIELNGDPMWMPADLLCFLEHTRVAAEPDSKLNFLAETPHYCWIRKRLNPGDAAIDCGANLGLFSVMMAKCVLPTGVVHAFEPSPTSRKDLLRVLRVNGAANVVVSPLALSNKAGRAAFCDFIDGDVRREASYLKVLDRRKAISAVLMENGMSGELHQREVKVSTTTIDAYTADHLLKPRLIKIDVEGAEFLLLEGARECIGACKPLLVIEIHYDARRSFDHARLSAYLDRYGYRYTKDDKIYYCEPSSDF
jgi:FkbM family methyltransferase